MVSLYIGRHGIYVWSLYLILSDCCLSLYVQNGFLMFSIFSPFVTFLLLPVINNKNNHPSCPPPTLNFSIKSVSPHTLNIAKNISPPPFPHFTFSKCTPYARTHAMHTTLLIYKQIISPPLSIIIIKSSPHFTISKGIQPPH